MKRSEAAASARQLVTLAALLSLLCSCRQATLQHTSVKSFTDRQVAVLNELRNEINLTYGFVDGWPRINRGPCGRFARIFHEQWNARFKEFDLALLDKRSYGLGRSYGLCPNYSDETTKKIVANYLDMLSKD